MEHRKSYFVSSEIGEGELWIANIDDRVVCMTKSMKKEFDKAKDIKERKPFEGDDHQGETYTLEEGEVQVYQETVTFENPSWKKLNKINQLSQVWGADGAYFVDQEKRNYNAVKYLLRTLSFVDIELGEDNDGDVYVKNMDELFGGKGLHPRILNTIPMVIEDGV